jgi:hypothetical protein
VFSVARTASFVVLHADTNPPGHEAQAVQEAEPPGLKLPATHAVQTIEVAAPAAAPYVPGLQVVQLLAPTDDVYAPTLHAVHALEPVVRALYEPTRHCVHTLV